MADGSKLYGDTILDALRSKSALATDANGLIIEGTPAVADHGGLTGLGDDDHPQYLLANKAYSLSTITYFGGL